MKARQATLYFETVEEKRELINEFYKLIDVPVNVPLDPNSRLPKIFMCINETPVDPVPGRG